MSPAAGISDMTSINTFSTPTCITVCSASSI